MFDTLPASARNCLDWDWDRFAPLYDDLAARPLSAASVNDWLADWTRVTALVNEIGTRLYVAKTVNTADEAAEQRYYDYLDHVKPAYKTAEDRLNRKLLDSGLQPDGFAVPLRNMRATAELFRADNLPLLADESKLTTEYGNIVGAQTVQWDGAERTVAQMRPVYLDDDRAKREAAWRLVAERQLADREAINGLWVKLMGLRKQIATNADTLDYRAFRWRDLLRFDYTPDDCLRFSAAIEEVVVPAATRVYERRRQRLGVETLRPWDLMVDVFQRPPLRPYQRDDELETTTSAIFHRVDPELGGYFDTMRREGLLDLFNRKHKAPGGYCSTFAAVRRPFIFMNAVNLHDDVQTMFHEGGHAFHTFESAHLPYFQQAAEDAIPIEFAEVASMAMELLAAPYLGTSAGGFYSDADARRARVEHLETLILFWPYMAVVDSFQHWVYTHHDAASDPTTCDKAWGKLWNRFMPGIDYSGLDDVMRTGWHRKLHIHEVPFYYVEYGLAQLGAVQVWRNSLRDQAGAVAAYRRALALGGTATLPELFAAAGAKFAFDPATLRDSVALVEKTIEQLEST